MMHKFLLCLCLLAVLPNAFAQLQPSDSQYEPTDLYPLGNPNPNAPEALQQFDFLVDVCDCWSVNRNPDGSWQDTLEKVWMAKYILNGTAIQDFSWRQGAFASTSVRQYDTTTHQWVVTFFSTGSVSLQPGTWLGAWQDSSEQMVLKRPQKAPNGQEGFSVLIFSNISENGFLWEGRWESPNRQFTWPFWRIGCTKRK